MNTPETNHYKWLELHFPKFIENLGLKWGDHVNAGIFSAHGDKFYGYRNQFKENGIHFYHGVAIGLLTYISPYSKECREITQGKWVDGKFIKGQWVSPIDWIVQNKERFLHLLPKENLSIEK